MSGNSAPTSTYIVKDLLFDGFLITCNKSTNASSLANLFCSSLKHFPNIRILSETEDGNLLGALFRYVSITFSYSSNLILQWPQNIFYYLDETPLGA